MSYTRTFILLAGLTGLFVGLGFLLGGQTGMVIAFVVAAGMNVFAYWNSDKVVLRMYDAHPVERANAPELYGIVEQLVQRAGLPMPAIYVIENEQPNAFATGRDPEHAAIAATTGLLQRLSHEEVAGVLAHELAHVKNRDTLVMTVTATLAGAIGMLANFAFFFGGNRDNGNNNGGGNIIATILIMVLAPLAAMLVQMAISRTREYEADRIGAEICGRPLWLASALERIHQAAERIPNETAEHNPATAHMFIINPLSGRGMDNLFSTHPDVANRVERLRAMAGQPAAPNAGPWGRRA